MVGDDVNLEKGRVVGDDTEVCMTDGLRVGTTPPADGLDVNPKRFEGLAVGRRLDLVEETDGLRVGTTPPTDGLAVTPSLLEGRALGTRVRLGRPDGDGATLPPLKPTT